MGKTKEIYVPREDAEIVEDVIGIVKEKIGITLFRKELWNILLQDPKALASLAIANLRKQTENVDKLRILR